jgi:unsaturated chondroitin disaccharide hydrolase
MYKVLFFCLLSFFLMAGNKCFDPDKELRYCNDKTLRNLEILQDYNKHPRSVSTNSKKWECVAADDWTSGFWTGLLWYNYEFSKNEIFKVKAESFMQSLRPLAFSRARDHDLGFQIFCSYGNAYRITHNPQYKEVILAAADTLATLYNPRTGTICSWPAMIKMKDWPHNTIIDNMMNLELLFWASKNGGSHTLYDIALRHATVTMNNHFRNDYSAYHVVLYDTLTGEKIKGITHQGYSDGSMWARGQTWAIYGFTMCYRETHNKAFLDIAQKAANVYLKLLPGDYVPLWDFDTASQPGSPKDASAAAVAASALLELSQLLKDSNQVSSRTYEEAAKKMLISLSGVNYQSRETNCALLLHSTGHKPANKEIDASIIYADYYYMEALIRLKKILEGKSI